MSITTHERPGVYSQYDASTVVSSSGGGQTVGIAALWCITLIFRDTDKVSE